MRQATRRLRFTFAVEHYDFTDDMLLVTYSPQSPDYPSALVRVRPGETEAETVEAILASAPIEAWELEADRRQDSRCQQAASWVGLAGEGRGVEVEQARQAHGLTEQQDADLWGAKGEAKAMAEAAAQQELEFGIEWTFGDGQTGRVQCTEWTVAFLTAKAVEGAGAEFRTLENESHTLSPEDVQALLTAVQDKRQKSLDKYWAEVKAIGL